MRRAGQITTAEIENEAKVLANKNASGVIGALRLFGRALGYINLTDLIIGLLTIFIIYGFKRITKAIPSTLVALLVISAGAYFILPEYRTIGNIPSGFPKLQLGIFGGFRIGDVTPVHFRRFFIGIAWCHRFAAHIYRGGQPDQDQTQAKQGTRRTGYW